MDTFSKEKRHEIMSKIRGKDTKIEIKVRHWLYNNGIRYRKNCKNIAGKPDIAIKKYKIAIFVQGCFWHSHENCKYSRLPKSNLEYWEEKLNRNIARDSENTEALQRKGWHVFFVWECQVNSNFESSMMNLRYEILKIKKDY
ncbi:MAG: very short patch repair endonuclease [Clostridia bacterium]|jgi:DNA mismatch endonuclease (patch repair protein)